jgi:hypothetical protein
MSEPHRESPPPTQAAPRRSAPAGTRQGKTLADIAGSTPGKSVEGLVTAVASTAKANLDALVASGRLSQSQADSVVSELTMRIKAMVQGDRFGGRPRWGFGGPPGDRPQPATPPGVTTL